MSNSNQTKLGLCCAVAEFGLMLCCVVGVTILILFLESLLIKVTREVNL